MRIIKRNGAEVDFDVSKIENAMRKASAEVSPSAQLSEDDIVYIAKQITKLCEQQAPKMVTVEEIQDMVESKLIQYNYAEVARCYIKYRFKHEMARNQYGVLMDAIAEKVNAKNVQNQNANVDERSFGGRIGEMSNLVMKQYAL